MEKVRAHPKDATHSIGINQFADWTQDEFKKMLGDRGVESKDVEKEGKSTVEVRGDLPSSVDWVVGGAVSPVKNQGQCGSCWSFSATGHLESVIAVKSGLKDKVILSEQNLVDCAYGKEWDNFGCDGGLAYDAFRYVEQFPLMTEADYPYLAKDPTTDPGCEYDASKAVAASKVATIGGMKNMSVDQLKTLVATNPISVSIEASQSTFHLYTGGVITSEECGTELDHAVLAVGYGTTWDGIDYFIVKNSWGTSWGELGYVRIGTQSTSKLGICGILTRPVYVDLA